MCAAPNPPQTLTGPGEANQLLQDRRHQDTYCHDDDPGEAATQPVVQGEATSVQGSAWAADDGHFAPDAVDVLYHGAHALLVRPAAVVVATRHGDRGATDLGDEQQGEQRGQQGGHGAFTKFRSPQSRLDTHTHTVGLRVMD